jgi:SAM-dependent methyltransferase
MRRSDSPAPNFANMPTPIEAVSSDPGLFCPDDSHRLEAHLAHLSCGLCHRRFPIHDGAIVELLPSEPTVLDETVAQSYRQSYVSEFKRPFELDARAMAWSSPESLPGRLVTKRRRQARWYISLLSEGAPTDETILCDFSAGPGYYTLDHASRFRLVMHCDLSVDSLNYARTKARSMRIGNIAFLRIDYFKPPFQSSLARIICCDTLIRGIGHDQLLLIAIRNSLRRDGIALVDFHNWWHNPLRRMGLLAQNFGDNVSYSRGEVKRLLNGQQIAKCNALRFHQEFDPFGLLSKSLGRFVPATRFVYRVRPDA